MENKEEEYLEMVKNIGQQLERAKLGSYVDLMQSPLRMLMLNLFAGMARGFGIAVGFTILGALLLYILQRLVILNLPIIGGVITEIVKLVQANIR